MSVTKSGSSRFTVATISTKYAFATRPDMCRSVMWAMRSVRPAGIRGITIFFSCRCKSRI